MTKELAFGGSAMQMYLKSVSYSNRLLKERICGGLLLDVGGAEYVDRANELAGQVDGVTILDPGVLSGGLERNVRHLKISVEALENEAGVGAFDHVLMSNFLEHVADPVLALRAIGRVMKAGGLLHVLSPNCESLNRRIGVLMGVLGSVRDITGNEVKMGHKHALSVGDVKRFLAEAGGYELVECRGVFLKPVPTDEMILWPEARIAAFFGIAGQIPPELCHEVYFQAVRV